MKANSLIFLLFASGQAFAGDYMLYVADKENTSQCANQSFGITKTSDEVVDSFNQYFSGEKPDIGILRAAFANCHFHFCGSKEIAAVLSALYKIKEEDPAENTSHLNGFIGKIEAIR